MKTLTFEGNSVTMNTITGFISYSDISLPDPNFATLFKAMGFPIAAIFDHFINSCISNWIIFVIRSMYRFIRLHFHRGFTLVQIQKTLKHSKIPIFSFSFNELQFYRARNFFQNSIIDDSFRICSRRMPARAFK